MFFSKICFASMKILRGMFKFGTYVMMGSSLQACVMGNGD